MKITVIIPTHNRAFILGRAIASVLKQDFSDWECLVVDDYSTDNTQSIVAEYSAKDSRVKYIKHTGERNLQAILNTGLHQAQGDYIARVDDDDYWQDEKKLTKQANFLDSHPDYVLIGSNACFELPDGKIVFHSDMPRTDSLLRRKALHQNYFLSSTTMFRKSTAIELGGFDEKLKLSGDYALWLAMGKVGKFDNLPDTMSTLRLSDAKSNQRRLTRVKDSIKIIKKFKNDYPSFWFSFLIRTVLLIYLSTPYISVLDRILYKIKTHSSK